jgi:hypothetical protein
VKRQRGRGTLEFAVVLAVFAVLAALLLDRLIELERDTERLEVALTVRHIHVGLKLAIGERLMRGEEARIPELLDRDPREFLGEADAKVGAGGTAAGSWHYAPQERLLSYRPRQPEAFDGNERLAWRFVGHADELGRVVGLRLVPLK